MDGKLAKMQALSRYRLMCFKMYTFSLSSYPSILGQIKLSSSDIVQQVSTYRLQFIQVRNQRVEWGIRLPMFVPSFYDFIIVNNIIPTQEQFYEKYLLDNKDFFVQQNFSEEFMYGLRARAYRTYPSLVRDVCFNKYVQEHLSGYDVVYNIALDIEEGIDLMLSKSGKHYAVSLYTNTNRAYVGRAAKVHRHNKFDNVEYIEFPVDFKGSLHAGDFFLYGEKEYRNLINLLR